LGAGGVGGLLAAVLAEAGHHVAVVLRSESYDHHPSAIELESPLGNVSTPICKQTRVVDTFDVLWIAVKAPQLEPALALVEDVNQMAIVVPLLNGVDHVALLRKRFGIDRVVPATILGECERVSPGHIVHRSPFVDVRIARAGERHLATAIEALRRFGIRCQLMDDEATLLSTKLVVLAPLALTTSASALIRCKRTSSQVALLSSTQSPGRSFAAQSSTSLQRRRQRGS
jgi:2-dehydropantoate 2-reductase